MIMVIVDMQESFKAARNEDLQRRIVHAIERQRKLGGPIIVLEYECFGPTVDTIKRALSGYEKRWYLEKCYDDGGTEVRDCVEAEQLDIREGFFICGVNTAYCVISTARGIEAIYPDVPIMITPKCCRMREDDSVKKTAENNFTEIILNVWAEDGPRRYPFVMWPSQYPAETSGD
jgi:nicotinamidase-related amidase